MHNVCKNGQDGDLRLLEAIVGDNCKNHVVGVINAFDLNGNRLKSK